ncbi:unnamed protein product, partial [Ilex paraguariensis]
MGEAGGGGFWGATSVGYGVGDCRSKREVGVIGQARQVPMEPLSSDEKTQPMPPSINLIPRNEAVEFSSTF